MWEIERSARQGAEADALGRLDREAVLTEMRRLRREGRPEVAARLASALADRLVQDGAVQAEAAACLFAAGDLAQAIARYERALSLDVRGAARLDCLIGAGNCLRLEGQWREALDHLAEARREFPRDGAARAFYALALCDQPRSRRRAAGELLAILLDTTASGRIRLHEETLRREAGRLLETPPRPRRPRRALNAAQEEAAAGRDEPARPSPRPGA